MAKKIIALIVCLAICVTGVAFGLVNKQAKNSSVAGSLAGSAVGAGALTENLNNGYDDSLVGAKELPTAATSDLDAGTLSGPVDGVYTLTGNVTINDANDTVYTALVAAFGVNDFTPGTTHLTLDGNGYTITTAIPLFDVIGNCTIKNLVVAGNITATDSDIVKDARPSPNIGIIAAVAVGTVNFEKVLVTASLNYVGSAVVNGAVAPFVGSVNGGQATTVSLTHCEFAGDIDWNSLNRATVLEVKGSGLVGLAGYQGIAYEVAVNVDKCTVSGSLRLNGHIGGIISDANAGATVAITNTLVDADIEVNTDYASTGYDGGFIGFVKSANVNISNCRVDGTAMINALHFDGETLAPTATPFGGFVGVFNAGKLNIEDVTSTIYITKTNGRQDVGGIVGLVTASAADSLTIDGVDTTYRDKVAKIAVSAKETVADNASWVSVGGIIGGVSGTVTTNISNISVLTSIVRSNSAGLEGLGGVVGSISAKDANVIVDGALSVIAPTITVASTFTSHAGGVIGRIYGGVDGTGVANLEVKNLEFTGSLVISRNNGSYYGGIIGDVGYQTTVVTGTDATTGENITETRVNRAKVTLTAVTFDGLFECNTAAADTRLGGMIGNIEALTSVDLTRCKNASDIVLLDTTDGGTYCVSGMVGRIQNPDSTSTLTFTDCVNEGDVIVDCYTAREATNTWNNSASGFVGFCYSTLSVVLNNCANIGDIAIYNHNVSTGIGNASAGGFIGSTLTTTPTITVNGGYNMGNVTVKQRTGVAGCHPSAAGFIGYCVGTNLSVSGFTNAGNIDCGSWSGNGYAYNASNYVLGSATSGTAGSTAQVSGIYPRAGGVVASYEGTDAPNINKCANLGNVTSSGGDCGAIVGRYAGADISKITNCVNTGKVSSTAFVHLIQTIDSVTTDFTNCYYLEGTSPKLSVNGGKHTMPGLSVVDFRISDEAVADHENGKQDLVFYVVINKNFYDLFEEILGDENVEFEGFVTLNSYIEKAGDFTHEALDALYDKYRTALEAKGISSLYMDATRMEQNITADDIVEGDCYEIKLRLKDYDKSVESFDAKAFIRYRGEAYVYSEEAIIANNLVANNNPELSDSFLTSLGF